MIERDRLGSQGKIRLTAPLPLAFARRFPSLKRADIPADIEPMAV
jgi:hypothetical protein